MFLGGAKKRTPVPSLSLAILPFSFLSWAKRWQYISSRNCCQSMTELRLLLLRCPLHLHKYLHASHTLLHPSQKNPDICLSGAHAHVSHVTCKRAWPPPKCEFFRAKNEQESNLPTPLPSDHPSVQEQRQKEKSLGNYPYHIFLPLLGSTCCC